MPIVVFKSNKNLFKFNFWTFNCDSHSKQYLVRFPIILIYNQTNYIWKLGSYELLQCITKSKSFPPQAKNPV